MEDEHQDTLKKKIQILYQLGKWPDVVKLCNSYSEKYGKEEEIDIIRFKSERHMGIPAPTPQQPAGESRDVPERQESPAAPAPEETISADPILPVISPTAADELMPTPQDKIAYDSSPEADDLDIGDPFLNDELVLSDAFADEKPEFSLAPEQPPVDISDIRSADETAAPSEPALEMEKPTEFSPASEKEEMETDLSNLGAMTIDAEPDLIPAQPEEKPSPESQAEPAATMFSPAKKETLEDMFHSGPGGADIVEKYDEIKPAATAEPAGEETSRRPYVPHPESFDQKAPARRKPLSLKLALLVILPIAAAAALWLALSGRLDFSGSEEPNAPPQPVATSTVQTKSRPAKPVGPPAISPQAVEQEKAFAEKFRQAQELDRGGNTLKAWAVLLEAKNIKVTEPLRRLEEQLARKMQEAEAQARKETEVVQNKWEMENQAFTRAEAVGTLAAWKDFLQKYPEGEMVLRAERKIVLLEKKAVEEAEQQLLLKIRQAQKVRLRAAYMNVSPAEIAAMARQGGKPSAQFQFYEHGGAKVMLDFTAGLMWTLWKKPMAYDKAKWWANRVTAGFSGWRLPTAEEALSLLQMDRGLYAGLADFVVWTGDPVSDQPRTVWALKLPAGQFVAAAQNQICFVWAVRKAGR